MRYFLTLFCLCWAQLAGAVSFDEHTRQVPLGREVAVFEDVRGNTALADITSSALEASFRRHDKDVLNAGYSRSVFWLRLDLQYQPTQGRDSREFLLELAYPPLDRLELYVPDLWGGLQRVAQTGDALPFATRVIQQNNYVFPLQFQAGERKRIYLRLQSEGSIQAPLSLWSSQAYLEAQPGRIYVLGIIYGVLLVMLVYNLFIYISVRDTSYLYYILYIASFGLYQISVNGAGVQYFWPDNPWWANAATPFLVGAAALFGSQFARSFLHTGEHSPWVDRILRVMMFAGGLVMLLALVAGYALALRLATLLALAFTLVIFSAGVISWWRGMRVARYFIFAWSAFLIGGLVNTLMVLGYLPNMFLTMYASQLGSALEVGLLSLALADRINAMKEERTSILQESSRKLALLNEELANSNRLKDEFLSTVTHELRTPMNGVIGSLELMQTVNMDIELAQYHKTAVSSARDMMHMVNDILALTELEAGKLYPRRGPFSLRALLDSLRVQFAGRAHDKGLNFELQLDDSLPDTLEGDAAKLTQTLGYLLDNAVKFTQQGRIILRVRGEQVSSSGLTLCVQVEDSGIGFAEQAGASLFQRFRQLDGSMTREYGGLGIGLALSSQLALLLGGELQQRSEPGRGSCFTLRVPVGLPLRTRAEQAPARQRREGTPVREPGQCVVLVVEDNAINQLVTRGMLLKLGYQVRTADNGAEAIELLRRETVDAVLLDCQMPVMDGFATARQLRALPGCAEVPVIAVTAHSHSGDRDRCLAAGMNDYLAKPVKFAELQVLLHDWVLCTASGQVSAVS